MLAHLPQDDASSSSCLVMLSAHEGNRCYTLSIKQRQGCSTHCRCAVAGEVTLTGKVLPIGGLKEKLLAAKRSDVTTVLFPEGNRRDWDELSGGPLVV